MATPFHSHALAYFHDMVLDSVPDKVKERVSRVRLKNNRWASVRILLDWKLDPHVILVFFMCSTLVALQTVLELWKIHMVKNDAWQGSRIERVLKNLFDKESVVWIVDFQVSRASLIQITQSETHVPRRRGTEAKDRCTLTAALWSGKRKGISEVLEKVAV